MSRLPRLHLIFAPTPVVQRPALSELIGVDLWIKRDDATGGAEAGNKIRKLELLLADALAKGARHVVTCGGIQSNHARATALACAGLGLGCTLLLRVQEGASGPERDAPAGSLPRTGNVLLDRLAGARIRTITPGDYAQRGACMAAVAAEIERLTGERAHVIPEGGSNGIGALGYVLAMQELRQQMDLGLAGGRAPFDEIVHACGSGGTAAGVALGARASGVADRVRAVAVCDDEAYFRGVIDGIVREARAVGAGAGLLLEAPAELVVDDRSKGPRYGVMDDDQLAFLVRVARASGLVLDPVYTGKALYGLWRAVERGDVARGARVLFLHTGGLPGLLAQGDAVEAAL